MGYGSKRGGGGGGGAGGKTFGRQYEKTKAMSNQRGQDRVVRYGDEEEAEDIRRRGESSSEDESSEESSQEESSEEEESSSEEEKVVVSTANPNRVKTVTKKLSEINVNQKTQLSRREKEEIDKEAYIARQKASQQKTTGSPVNHSISWITAQVYGNLVVEPKYFKLINSPTLSSHNSNPKKQIPRKPTAAIGISTATSLPNITDTAAQVFTHPAQILTIPIRILTPASALRPLKFKLNITNHDFEEGSTETPQESTKGMELVSKWPVSAYKKSQYFPVPYPQTLSQYDSNNTRKSVMDLLNKFSVPAFRLGDSVCGTFDFSIATIPCYKILVKLECEETIEQKYLQPSRNKPNRRLYGELHEYTTNIRQTHFMFHIPVEASQEFSTKHGLRWVLIFWLAGTSKHIWYRDLRMPICFPGRYIYLDLTTPAVGGKVYRAEIYVVAGLVIFIDLLWIIVFPSFENVLDDCQCFWSICAEEIVRSLESQ
eukprot:gene16935-20143_t